jgi:hypothetical protein
MVIATPWRRDKTVEVRFRHSLTAVDPVFP